VLLAVMITLAGTPRRWAEGRLALALLALALALAVLGVYTPGSRVPAVAIGNLLGGFVMLALAARLALIAGRGPTRAPPLGAAAWLAAAVLSVQIVLGAQVSASHAGVACSGWGQCLELARAGAWDLAALDPWQAAEPGAPRGAFAQWLHRVGSVAAAAAVASAALAAWRRERRSLAATAIALTALLALFGWTQGAFGLPLAVVLLHNLGAAVLLALLVREA
jgi:cytochrome c oxidase assembly protein subunit 15